MLEFLFNKVGGLKVYNFIKKETPSQLFFSEYRKFLRTAFCMEHRRLLLKMFEEFLRNSNLTLEGFVQKNLYEVLT